MFGRGLCKNDFLKSRRGATVDEWNAYWKGLNKSERKVCPARLPFSRILTCISYIDASNDGNSQSCHKHQKWDFPDFLFGKVGGHK